MGQNKVKENQVLQITQIINYSNFSRPRTHLIRISIVTFFFNSHE
uniref:Uncharacterized protein n=1 Tax=Rhizophora mucronata TaxID=61149 RepID=A0A2P2QTU4_RHIMU